MTAPAERLSWITWLKALGMLVIVFGHVAAAAPGATLPPINTKQLGVAFFLFITGFTLTRERRRPAEVVFNRLFEVYVVGLALAILISICAYAASGSIRKSNYAPFVFGANVFFDFFPSNPTTWYVGTYAQLLLLWAAVERRWNTWLYLPAVVVGEIALRAFLLSRGYRFIPYMWLSNWAAVYCLGRWAGRAPSRVGGWFAIVLAVAALALTWWLLPPLLTDFPFWLPRSAAPAEWLRVSAAVTAIYTAVTVLLFAGFQRIAFVPRPIDLIARHTLVIFLAHMPLYYLLLGPATDYLGSGALRALALGGVCLFVPAGGSSLLSRAVDLKNVRAAAWRHLSRGGASPARRGAVT